MKWLSCKLYFNYYIR